MVQQTEVNGVRAKRFTGRDRRVIKGLLLASGACFGACALAIAMLKDATPDGLVVAAGLSFLTVVLASLALNSGVQKDFTMRHEISSAGGPQMRDPLRSASDDLIDRWRANDSDPWYPGSAAWIARISHENSKPPI